MAPMQPFRWRPLPLQKAEFNRAESSSVTASGCDADGDEYDITHQGWPR
jgi:hypothetical protein